MGAPLTLDLDDATLLKLRHAAELRELSVEELAGAAVELFLADDDVAARRPLEPWQQELVRQGIEDAERGHFASDEEVERFFRKYRE